MKVIPLLFVALTSLSACAEVFLEQNIRAVEGETLQLDDYDDMVRMACQNAPESRDGCSISGAIQLAYRQADAYAQAARRSQVSQDLAFAALLGTAGWTALGAANGVSNAALAERAVGAVAVQQGTQRGVPRTAVQSLYTGANRMNCIALAGSLYQEVNMADLTGGTSLQAFPAALGSFVMVLAMREVEYRTLYGMSRDLEDFSVLAQAFSAAASSVIVTDTPAEPGRSVVSGVPGSRSLGERTTRPAPSGEASSERYVQRNPALERFFGVVSGCLDSTTPEPNIAAQNTPI